MAQVETEDCPSHRHAPVSAAAKLAEAERICARRGGKLTTQRRLVLEQLLAEGRAIGAYDLIERVAARAGKRIAPISIYRALDFLTENDLVHRIESRNAFLACPGGHGTHSQVVFMICEVCGQVGETTSGGLEQELARLADDKGFFPRTRVIEMAGVCAACIGTHEHGTACSA